MADIPKAAKCANCQKSFNIFWWRHQCESCKDIYCSKCLVTIPQFEWLTFKPIEYNRLCNTCGKKILNPVIEKYNNALSNRDIVQTFPSTYKGKIKTLESDAPDFIETNYCNDRNEAENMLKITAAYYGCDVVYDIKWDKHTGSQPTGKKGKGTYYYSQWSAIGIPAILDK
jgi:hypothetical protein